MIVLSVSERISAVSERMVWKGLHSVLSSPKGEERSRIPPEVNEMWKQFVYKQKPKVCRLSLPIIILHFLFVLYNVQDEKQVILLGNSQRCHFIGSVALSSECVGRTPHPHEGEPGATCFVLDQAPLKPPWWKTSGILAYLRDQSFKSSYYKSTYSSPSAK